MKLKSMKITKAEREAKKEKYDSPIGYGSGGPDYPYGLTLRLDNEALEKLGCDHELPAAGTTMKLEAKIEVVSTSQQAGKGHKNRSIEFQIVAMALEGGDDVDAVSDGVRKAGK